MKSNQIQSLAHGMPGTKRNRQKKAKCNHEKFRTCDRCGNEVDIRKELDPENCHCGGKFK
jgi:hypothetical protein